MTRLRLLSAPSHAALFAPVLALALACGGGASTPSPHHDESSGGELATPSWEVLEGEALRQYVHDRAHARLEEVMPEATREHLHAWMADPASAPALGGRAVERALELAATMVAGGTPAGLAHAKELIALVRARAANRNSAYAGNTLLSEIARREAGDDPAAQRAAVAAVFRQLPRTRFGSSVVVFQVFQTQEQLAAQLEQIQQQLVSLETAAAALYFAQVLPEIVAHRDVFMGAIEELRAEHAAAPPLEEYAFGTVDLHDAADAHPVRVGVWDVGTNPELFAEQLFENEAEPINGEDDDGDGRVDDRSGVVQDRGRHTDADLLFRPSDETLAGYTNFLQGIMDLRAGIASSEAAQQVLQLMRSVENGEQLEELERNLDAIGEWAHGTHVAGIVLQGLPQAELAIFRSAWAGEARLYHHRGPSDEELDEERANIDAIASFINRHGIQVVNASLGFSREYVADALRHQGELYPTDAAVMARAAEIHRRRAENWAAIFAACPRTLFVVAAGNANQDVLEYEDIPASLASPNLLVIGAVDRYGQWATFTNSHPERVRVFDFGVEVPSLIPNGETVPLSGTSMASPNAANLAAKILSVNPALTPAEVIAIIEETGDAIAPPFNGVIANEVRAVTRARELAAPPLD